MDCGLSIETREHAAAAVGLSSLPAAETRKQKQKQKQGTNTKDRQVDAHNCR